MSEVPKDRERPDEDHRHERDIVVLVNNRDVVLPRDRVTGLEIKTAAGVPPSFKLFDPHGDEIADDVTVHVHTKERFTAISGQDVS